MLTLVNIMNYLPQEIEARYIIPAIRRDTSKCLVRDFSMSYEKVGNILGISKAAISQYFKGKRAAKICLPKEIGPKMMIACKTLAKHSDRSVEEINKILDFIKMKGLPCRICKHIKEGKLRNCKEFKFVGGNYRAVNKPNL